MEDECIFHDGTLFFNNYIEATMTCNKQIMISVLIYSDAKNILMRNHINMSEEIESSVC